MPISEQAINFALFLRGVEPNPIERNERLLRAYPDLSIGEQVEINRIVSGAMAAGRIYAVNPDPSSVGSINVPQIPGSSGNEVVTVITVQGTRQDGQSVHRRIVHVSPSNPTMEELRQRVDEVTTDWLNNDRYSAINFFDISRFNVDFLIRR